MLKLILIMYFVLFYFYSLTFHTTLAELTSLEQLLSTMMARNKIPIPIISKLWKIFSKFFIFIFFFILFLLLLFFLSKV